MIGFVGGLVSHDNTAHSEIQMANRLHNDHLVGVSSQLFETAQREQGPAA